MCQPGGDGGNNLLLLKYYRDYHRRAKHRAQDLRQAPFLIIDAFDAATKAQ